MKRVGLGPFARYVRDYLGIEDAVKDSKHLTRFWFRRFLLGDYYRESQGETAEGLRKKHLSFLSKNGDNNEQVHRFAENVFAKYAAYDYGCSPAYAIQEIKKVTQPTVYRDLIRQLSEDSLEFAREQIQPKAKGKGKKKQRRRRRN